MADQATLPPEIAAQDKGPGILAAIISVSILSTLFVAGRLFVRIKVVKKLQLDDYLIMPSTVSPSSSLTAPRPLGKPVV
jgi:hypothetical protein